MHISIIVTLFVTKVIFPIEFFWYLCWKSVYVRFYFWTLTLICLSLCQYHIVLITVVLWQILKLEVWVQLCSTKKSFWLFCVPWITIWVLVSICAFLQKKAAGILTMITLNALINLGSTAILAILSLLIYERGISFHLFRFLISFNDILQCSMHKSCLSFVIFIRKYFILFKAIVNMVVFLISFFWIFHC